MQNDNETAFVCYAAMQSRILDCPTNLAEKELTMSNAEKSTVAIALTDDQKKQILAATGIALKELTVVNLEGEKARALSANVVKAVTVVCCW